MSESQSDPGEKAEAESTPIQFPGPADEQDAPEREVDASAGKASIETLVLLAGPAPRPDGPSLDVLLEFLDPARRAALAFPARERVVLCCGDAGAETLLERLGRWPFDRVIRIAPPIDGPLASKGLARLLAAAVQKLGAELVLAGDRGAEWNRALTGPAVARTLDWTFLTGATGPFTLSPEGLLARQNAWETSWSWRIQMPALLSVADAGVDPSADSAPAERASPETAVWTLSDLELQEEDVLPLCKPSHHTGRRTSAAVELKEAREVLDWILSHRPST